MLQQANWPLILAFFTLFFPSLSKALASPITHQTFSSRSYFGEIVEKFHWKWFSKHQLFSWASTYGYSFLRNYGEKKVWQNLKVPIWVKDEKSLCKKSEFDVSAFFLKLVVWSFLTGNFHGNMDVMRVKWCC